MIESQEYTKNFSLKQTHVYKLFSRRLPKLLSLGLGVILISWLLAQVDISSVHLILQDISLVYVLAGFLFYGMSFYFRAKRFGLLLPTDKPLKALFPIVLVHYTALNIIPARLGELSYVYLLKKLYQIPAGCSVSTLLLARVFDQIAISLLFLLSLGLVEMEAPWLRTISWAVGAILFASVICLLFLLAYKEVCLELLKKLLNKLNWNCYTTTQRIINLLEEILMGFDEMKSKKTISMVFGQSLLIWIGILSVNYSVWKAFHIPLSYVEVVLSSTFLILLTVIPFQVFSGLGIRSITWAAIAEAMGVSKDVAIVSAFGSRIILTLFLFILGAYGLWKISRQRDVT